MIEPENLSNAMDYLFEEKKDCSQAFNILKDQKIYNFERLFVYHLIRKQVDVKEFEVVYKEIINNSPAWQLRQIYQSFFNTDVKLGIERYLEKDRYNNDFSDVQNMRYIFITKENNQIALEPTSLEYLKVMLSNGVPEDVSIAPFFYDFTHNLYALKPILEVVNNSPEGKKILTPLFHAISITSYEYPESTNKNSYNVLIETLSNIQTEFEKNLVYKKSHPDPCLEIDPGLMNFLNISKADITTMINNRYQEEYKILLQNPVDVSGVIPIFQKSATEKPFVNLAVSLSASIEMGYKENIALDLSQIDTNEPALKNFIYLKFLEVKLKNNEPVKASLELCDYMRTIHQKEKQSLIPSVGSFLDLEMMASKVLHSRFDSDLKEKAATVRKQKI